MQFPTAFFILADVVQLALTIIILNLNIYVKEQKWSCTHLFLWKQVGFLVLCFILITLIFLTIIWHNMTRPCSSVVVKTIWASQLPWAFSNMLAADFHCWWMSFRILAVVCCLFCDFGRVTVSGKSERSVPGLSEEAGIAALLAGSIGTLSVSERLLLLSKASLWVWWEQLQSKQKKKTKKKKRKIQKWQSLSAVLRTWTLCMCVHLCTITC